jgi:hypothetical protein
VGGVESKMRGMRSLNKESRLQADSVDEIAGEFAARAQAIGRRKVKFGRRNVSGGPLLNALALSFLQLDAETQRRYAEMLIARLEVFMAETDAERERASSRLHAVRGERIVLAPIDLNPDSGTRPDAAHEKDSGVGQDQPKAKPRRKSQ